MTLLTTTIERIGPLDAQSRAAATERQMRLTKPAGALGRLETLSAELAGMVGMPRPRFTQRALVVAAASHGVAEEGVSAYPPAVTAQMVANFLGGGAAINVLADAAGAQLVVVDTGVADTLPADPRLRSARLAAGTRNMLHEPAMPREHAPLIVEAGIRLLDDLAATGLTLLGIGEMGIGNTTAASAIVAAALGADVASVTGRGTLIDDVRLRHKIDTITRAISRHRPDAQDGLALLHTVGGYEIGFLAGCCLGAAANRIPIVLDGFITSAAALIAVRLCPAVRDYMIAAHCSVEPGHRIVLDHLRLQPLLDLQLRLGEGSGAALAFPIVVAAARLLDEMATFDEAAVDEEV